MNEQCGDYYTNVDVHPIFAEILAKTFYQEWNERLRGEECFDLVELGCGNGKLAEQILIWLAENAQDCFQKLRYTGIERSEKRIQSCKRMETAFGNKVQLTPEFSFPTNSVTGIIFSNEFFDALPFERVLKKGNQLLEVFLDHSLRETLAPATENVKAYFQWLGSEPKEGCYGEAHLSSKEWMEKISAALGKGMVFTIDYGFESEELYSEFRTEGTALCHYRHQTNREFYKRLGLQDLTTHINFTTLIKSASKGIQNCPLITQSNLILDKFLNDLTEKVGNEKDPRKRLKLSAAIQSLIHPEGMGNTFKVLIQRN
ncbi:MAG: SAM-dependent methyltransferase [Elusimicrobia bacterium]|nr:SAM-dependent methyltransferase [Elusimicrobiota bacterium]